MGVTIDSIQIEIESSSTNAAKGIDALAKSLEGLKKNGSFKSVSTNLNNLATALKALPNVYQTANSLRTLANSIEKLKSVGTVSSLANSLKKLPDALKSVSTIDLDRTEAQLKEVVRAVSPLSNIKAGGLGTMVNAMKNLGKVTESLDEKTITAFAEKVDLLVKKLGPLSEKMSSIKAGFGAINTGARQAASGTKEFTEEVDASALNLSSFIEIMRTAIDAMRNLVQNFTEFISQAIEWDGIAARFGRGFAGQASETYAWIQRLNEEMGINIQEFMKYSSVYSTMLTGFGVAAEDAGKMALGYMELTYDIWAGYNDVYGSLEETAEAVKSAIAGEVEPVRRAGFTIVESTLAQTAANHGLEISLEKATEAQKSYLRYLTLVDQAHAQGLVGTYAKEMNTAEGLMRTLAQQLKSLTQAFGSLFLPILVRVLPYIQAFVELLTEGVQALAALFGITIQGVEWGDYNSGASDAIENTEGVAGALGDAAQAAKELKHATLGIDELNVISPSSSTSGGNGAGSGSGGTGFEDLDVDSLWDESIFKDINSQVDELKEKLKSWLPIIAAIGSGIAAWGMASLIESAGKAMVKLSEMEGKIGMLKKAIAGLAILTIEAVLVFALSDEYLESGNLMALLGEALATAAGGYLMYKGFGPKGLVLSLAVSIAAQLVAITMNLADGGVEIDDPQLWIQSAFTTALGGVAGGFLAYKGLIPVSTGEGIGLGVVAALSLTLAAITIGEVTANGGVTAESIYTGIGSVLAAAGFGFMIGGPWGAAIGAAVGLTINIVGAAIGVISKNAEQSLKEDMESRFGKITLDKESLEVYVETITAVPRTVSIDRKVWNEKLEEYEIQTVTIPMTAALEIAEVEHDTLEKIRDSLETSLERLGVLNLKIAVGVDVEDADYATAINTFVQNSQEYIDQFYLTANISLGIIDSDNSTGLDGFLSDFYMETSSRLSKLGSELKKTVSEGFVDGEWLPGKREEAIKLQNEIQEIVDYVSDVEYRAELQNLKLSVSGDALTASSFEDVLDGAKEAIEGKLDSLEEVKMSALKVAIMNYDAMIAEGKTEEEAKAIYDKTVADIEREFEQGKLELSYGTVDFGISTLQEAFANEIARAESEGWFDFSKHVKDLNSLSLYDFEGENNTYDHLSAMLEQTYAIAKTYTNDLSKEARKNLEELLESLEPTMEDYEEIAEANREAGTTVTQSIREGLNDYNELKALSGDTDAINYLIGQGFATDTTFLNTLATAKNAGKQIDDSVAEGLLNNITYVTDEATGVVTGIKNSITGEVIAVTPTLVDNMEQLGVDLSTGLADGVESDKPSLWERFTNWVEGIVDWVKGLFDSHSPSRVFMKIGGDLSDGLGKGMETNTIKDKMSTMWNNAKTWWNEKKGSLKSYTPSIGSIYDKLKERWDNARTWWNDKKTKAKEYTPSIGSIYEKLYDRWKNARDWWNNKKGSFKSYTPSIGSIVDKVKSAWNSAKSWWSKNVGGLSTKLNISVPKLTVNWGEVSALGKTFKYPKSFSVKFAANGGIFDQGSLIWAGERGPEVMATAAGGKTGVMNVQQMQDAVYEGVYAAVSAAMRGMNGGGSQEVRVYLDGREISASVKKHQHESGASIMGNEVYSY